MRSRCLRSVAAIRSRDLLSAMSGDSASGSQEGLWHDRLSGFGHKGDGALSDDRTALYRTHRGALVDYASTITGSRAQAEDVVQEAWIRLEGATRDRTISNPLHYLYRVVRNLSLDGLRRTRFEQRLMGLDVDSVAELLPDERASQEAAVIAASDYAALTEALAELPERTRIAFEMHRLGAYKLKEIAAHLDISVGLAHRLVADALSHCSERLERGG